MAKKKQVCKELHDYELFDIEDVTWDIDTSRSRKTIEIKGRSDTNWNVLKLYLALKREVDKMGIQLGMFVEDADEGNPQ
jgi:hypothetical protein